MQGPSTHGACQKASDLESMDVKDDYACGAPSGQGNIGQDPREGDSCRHITLCLNLRSQSLPSCFSQQHEGAHRLCSSLYTHRRLTRRLMADDVMSRAILLCCILSAEGSFCIQDNC